MTMTEDDTFYSLIDNHDLNEIKNYYKQNKSLIDINKSHVNGETALHKAIGTGCDKMIRFIMRLRPDIEARSSRSWTALHKAVHEDNLMAVNILLAHNADVNSRTVDHGKTPLHMAVFNDSMTIATSLLKQKANPNLLISSGAFQQYSALHIAVMNNHLEMVKLLLNHNADTELKCHQGYTALWLAVLNSYTSIIECLCALNANCNAKPCAGPYRNCTPLFAAVELNKLQMIQVLIKYRADVNAIDNIGRTPLYHAVYLSHQETARLLLKRNANINVCTYSGEHALFAAVANKNYAMVKWLLNNGANVNTKRIDGFTPLHCAVVSACYTVAKLLIKHNAKVNVERSWCKYTPLHDAVRIGDELMVHLLLQKKAKVNMKNSKGQTPLHIAAAHGSWRIANKLLKYGGNPNICDKSNSTPLHLAAKANQFKTVVLLIQFGAKINVYNKKEETPLYFAVRSKNESICNVLMQRGAQFSTKCVPKSNKGYFPYITDERSLLYLINRGVDVNHRSTAGETALHRLIQVSVPEVLAYLTSYSDKGRGKPNSIFIYDNGNICDELVYAALVGKEIQGLGVHDFNAIHMAIHKRAIDIFNCCMLYINDKSQTQIPSVSFAVGVATNTDAMKGMLLTLLNNGSDINCPDKLGYTPLHLATKCQRYAYMSILLEKGARVDVEDCIGATPLTLAIRNKDQTAVTILLRYGATSSILKSHALKYGDHDSIPRILVQFELVKKKFIEDRNWPDGLDSTFQTIINDCKAEIDDLSRSYVGNSKLQYINLVTKPIMKIVPFLRNPEIKRELDSKRYSQMYPIFTDEIKMKIGLAKIKHVELARCKQILGQLFDGTIPSLVVDKITGYLDNVDHKTLASL